MKQEKEFSGLRRYRGHILVEKLFVLWFKLIPSRERYGF